MWLMATTLDSISLKKYLLSACYELGTLPDIEIYIYTSKGDKDLCFRELTFLQ